MKPSVRLGAVSYLNVEPLIAGLENDRRFVLSRESPARVADQLQRGDIDLATIPSIEYARNRYAMVRGIGIASRGAVRSVRLYHRRPLSSIRTVALDVSSRTSIALLRIVLEARGVRAYDTTTAPPDVDRMLGGTDAALVIGDAALAYAGDADSLDLGEAWASLTGLPFVYAFWAGRPDALELAHIEALERAVERGLAEIPAIAARYNGSVALGSRLKEAYLRENIGFRLGGEEYAGLAEFFDRAAALGILPEAPALRFYGER